MSKLSQFMRRGKPVVRKPRGAIMVAMATHRTPMPDAITNMRKVIGHFGGLGTGLDMIEMTNVGCLMHVAHAKATTYALSQPDCEAVLFWDDDMVVPVTDDFNPILRLWAQDKDVIGGLYTNRSQPLKLHAGWTNEDGVMECMTDEKQAMSNEPIRVDFVASGFLMVRRRALERMVERICPVEKLFQAEMAWRFMPEVEERLKAAVSVSQQGDVDVRDLKDELDRIWRNSQQLGTDLSFCLKAREAGCEVWVDPSFDVRHIGNYSYGRIDWLAQQMDKREKATQHA